MVKCDYCDSEAIASECHNHYVEGWVKQKPRLTKKLIERLLGLVDDFFDKKQKEMKAHVEGFGKGNNRDIDLREKSTLLILPVSYRKKLKEIFTKEEVSESGN